MENVRTEAFHLTGALAVVDMAQTSCLGFAIKSYAGALDGFIGAAFIAAHAELGFQDLGNIGAITLIKAKMSEALETKITQLLTRQAELAEKS